MSMTAAEMIKFVDDLYAATGAGDFDLLQCLARALFPVGSAQRDAQAQTDDSLTAEGFRRGEDTHGGSERICAVV
ncbi:MAG: hypothetical protein B7X99_14850 [Rhizobiales bacterium 17-65-6]|nr:MAG: hypothetical protein B7X99_14850 [Rhizobiales bacterium 17-65-6]